MCKVRSSLHPPLFLSVNLSHCETRRSPRTPYQTLSDLTLGPRVHTYTIPIVLHTSASPCAHSTTRKIASEALRTHRLHGNHAPDSVASVIVCFLSYRTCHTHSHFTHASRSGHNSRAHPHRTSHNNTLRTPLPPPLTSLHTTLRKALRLRRHTLHPRLRWPLCASLGRVLSSCPRPCTHHRPQRCTLGT